MSFIDLWNMDITSIWKLTDQTDFIVAMNGWLCRKSNYGENLDALNADEQIIYISLQLDTEVHNGGFIQFFDYFSSAITDRISDCMSVIGAHRTAEICKTALAVLPSPIPKDWDERRKFLDAASVDIEGILSECDNRFYDCEDDLMHLNYLYIHAHKDSFS